MQDTNPYPLMISVVVTSAAQLASVYALLGGAAPAAIAANQSQRVVKPGEAGSAAAGADDLGYLAGGGEPIVSNAEAEATDVDAHGHPWSAELHASTKGKTKDGLWRMKVGVQRPAPLPGFPIEEGASNVDTGTSAATTSPSATSGTATVEGAGQPATSADEDDEFAAFRKAAETSDAADAAAAASIPARTYSDADLGALCNQAAVKLGDPSPIKEIIAKYVPEGEVAHSRNIPEDKRAEFVGVVEAKAGIVFAG